jgi:hypothetical protein
MKRAEAQIEAARALVALGTLYVLSEPVSGAESVAGCKSRAYRMTYRNGFMQAVGAIAQTSDGS